MYSDWTSEPFKSALNRAVIAKMQGLEPQLAVGEVIIPQSTLRRAVGKFEKEKAELVLVDDNNEEYAYLARFNRASVKEENNKNYPGLTTPSDRDFLQKLITLHDFNKKAMTKGEVI